MGQDKFIQPADGITIVSRSGRGTLLNEETLERGRERVAAGEDPEVVAAELARYEELLLKSIKGDQ